MSTEAMKLALEALEGIHPGNMTPMAEEYWNKAITALQEALAQPQQGPSGWQKIECPICGDMAIATDIPAAQPQQEPVAAVAWQQGYDQGVADERISEANIGIAGFNAKVNPAKNNPYTSPQPAPVQQEPDAIGCKCLECGEWQRSTPSGMTCKNGHGGVQGINYRLYTSPPAQEFVCSTGLCHYRKPLTPDLEADTGYSRDERAAFTAGWEAAEAAHGIKGDA